ncbi:ribosome small subunit-dependent GTPase A [Methylicorpusculum sp.]|uniref:ribosome small subunit-dependent GTPase A n=1 Tax=Methylicorpusculum sp. TaxID=2713644 RepID=UPI002730CAA5|nr:ribosome small subunit-dependent GTPase A [Methylicorpusculum sp.]MDP2180182.1 ribosome small subunit-dependent GTPase A [Methylicorpusculum sp.]MDP3530737.1 ribosome small subunit-dependent GTPase A [Methylicorpusculum sp.]MDZ4154505.1 ribosome small subunit-dependent GTPase A [Methylicorpusculum sp.]
MNELIEGLVISHLGQGIAVQYNDTIILCQPRRKLETVAVGDRVLWRLSSPDQGSIEEILPRRSLLIRPSSNGKIRPVAANIDRVFVVVAVEPFCDFLLIDQYLAVCENRDIDAAIILNKIDLVLPEALLAELDIYSRLGYPFYTVSTYDHRGLDSLNSALKDQTSILAGQSGVGKSSLTKTLIPDLDLKTKTLSETTRHGRHTTTAATLYHLPGGGDLIDSPGVAIFGLAGLTERHLAYGFRDFQPYIDQCQFNDCRHDKDKGCAIRVAIEKGDISASRYQRFLKLREKMTLA